MRMFNLLRSTCVATARSAGVFVRDVGHGALELGHNGLALVGLTVVVALAFVAGRPDLREQTEAWALDWLQQRLEARSEETGEMPAAFGDAEAVNRATAVQPSELTRPQAAVAKWISRRYNVALEPVGRLVQEAWTIGEKVGIEPTLILAIVAIESRFNPFAQSAMGAQGLMQVMTSVHGDKYEAFGGTHAAFDPISNLRVGVQVLRECIARSGSLEAGLRWYVGAANLESDNGYLNKVVAEHGQLQQVARGKVVAPAAPSRPKPAPATAQPEPSASPAETGDERVALLH